MEIKHESKSVLMRNFDKINLECEGLKNTINMTVKEIIESIEYVQLIESGTYSENVAQKWINFNLLSDISKEKQLVAGLNNCDNSYVTICLLEKDPVSVFEGMAIAGLVANISKGILYIPKEKKILKEELENILNKINLFGFQIEIFIGKIDIEIINENVLIHHIETLASIAAYFTLGKDYVQTKIISVTGSVKSPGIGEVTSNSNIKKIIKDIAGGTINNVKTIVVGGKTGKCITESETEKFTFNGYGMNEIIVLNNEDCIVDFAKQGLVEVYEKTCGKCTFCREGSYQLRQILLDATEGKGKVDDIGLMEEISNGMSEGTLCSLGQKGTDFLQTSLELFKVDYETHIKRKKCSTGFCKAFLNIAIMGNKCDGCGECMDVCDCDAIEGKGGYIHMIDEFECSKCGNCIEMCPNSAIVKITANKTVGPHKLTRVGRWKKRG